MLLPSSALFAQKAIVATPRYQNVANTLEETIQQEMTIHSLPAVSIVLVDGNQVVWSQGFGSSDPVKKTPATAETIYRVGSVSKLFTDVAIMQMVEQGKLALDVPVTRYLPEFHPANPFGKPITLRELMSHRSGLYARRRWGTTSMPASQHLKRRCRA